MNPELHRYLADAVLADRLREAQRFGRARTARNGTPEPYEPVTVRLAHPADAESIARLSELEGSRLPVAPMLVAEVGGVVLAARSLENGAAVADPFRPTRQLVKLLELRAAHLRKSADGPRGLARRLRLWLRPVQS